MSKKRGFIDAVLTGTAASAIFGQDVADVEDFAEAKAGAKAPVKAPERKAAPATTPAASGSGGVATAPQAAQAAPPAPPTAPTGSKITEPQRKRFYAIYKHAGLEDDAVKAYLKQTYGIEHTADITRDFYEAVCAWAERGGVEEPPAEPGSNG
jgi:septal ring-binding cell division protein DamX